MNRKKEKKLDKVLDRIVERELKYKIIDIWDNRHEILNEAHLYIIEKDIQEFLNHTDIKELFESTATQINGQEVDDGPPTFYSNSGGYKKRGDKVAELCGMTIIDYLLGDFEDLKYYVDDSFGKAIQVTYFPSGIVGKYTPMSQEELRGNPAYKAWFDDIQKTAEVLGMSFLEKFKPLEIKDIVATSEETYDDSKEEEEDAVGGEKELEDTEEDYESGKINENLSEPFLEPSAFGIKNLDDEEDEEGEEIAPEDDDFLTLADIDTLVTNTLGGLMTSGKFFTSENKLCDKNIFYINENELKYGIKWFSTKINRMKKKFNINAVEPLKEEYIKFDKKYIKEIFDTLKEDYLLKNIKLNLNENWQLYKPPFHIIIEFKNKKYRIDL